VRLLLDTCALIALAEREPMRAEAVAAIRAAHALGRVLVPSVAALEVAQKMAARKLTLGGGATARAWFEAALGASRFRHVPVTADMALAAYELPEPFHRDPADRLVVATARLLRAAVVTVDARILAYGRAGHVATLAY
jgi:PIN domain nuclease of toxin-antitoxin system